MKATIRVYGTVQAVGYRVLVKHVAASLGVRGLVRNLEDGSVEIFAEAPEGVLAKFLDAINVKGRPGDILALNVERIEVYEEGKPGYRGPWRSYTGFEIDYGEEKLRPIERDIAESLEWAKLYFTKLVSEFGSFHDEFRDFREEFRDFRSEFRDFRGEFRDFREEFRDFRREFQDFRSEFRDFRDEFRGFRDEFRDFREEFRDFRGEFRDFRDKSLELGRRTLGEIEELRKDVESSLGVGRETLSEVRELRRDLRALLDERLARIERDIAVIKAKLGLG